MWMSITTGYFLGHSGWGMETSLGTDGNGFAVLLLLLKLWHCT